MMELSFKRTLHTLQNQYEDILHICQRVIELLNWVLESLVTKLLLLTK